MFLGYSRSKKTCEDRSLALLQTRIVERGEGEGEERERARGERKLTTLLRVAVRVLEVWFVVLI